MTDDSELQRLLFDGRRRAQVGARLIRRLDQQITALMHAADSDIERIEQDAQKLISFTDLFLVMPMLLSSDRDRSQLDKGEKKLADLKTVLTTRLGTKWIEGRTSK